MAEVRLRVIIEGRVQGVWFRDSTRRQALSLGLSGWVRNLPDGSVEAVFEGPEGRVRQMVSWCHRGPPAARVLRVQETPEAWRGEFDSFEVAY